MTICFFSIIDAFKPYRKFLSLTKLLPEKIYPKERPLNPPQKIFEQDLHQN
tara:strand:+ start:224 stop:376 length:153 start_codon:yes stop_codon:yes gene_type:complete